MNIAKVMPRDSASSQEIGGTDAFQGWSCVVDVRSIINPALPMDAGVQEHWVRHVGD
jgi:hypothetical protein